MIRVNTPRCWGFLRAITLGFQPVDTNAQFPETKVLVNVVAAIYAPLIHGFSQAILKNIQTGVLPFEVIAPPRDAIPLASSLLAQAEIKGIDLHLFEPPVNRNTAGIANNQKSGDAKKSPFLDLMFDQTKAAMNGATSVVEIETGIYGTTSKTMAAALKDRGVINYYPVKFYGLGPNLSFVHAVLSKGKEWVAENAEASGVVNKSQIVDLMILLDTMEELGMEKFYHSVEKLMVGEDGLVKPVKMAVSEAELEIATWTNQVIRDTAPLYSNMPLDMVTKMLDDVPKLVKCSKGGFPFTLTKAIPPMDSKEEHFDSIRNSKLFDYPKLII